MEIVSNPELKILLLGSYNETEVLSGPEKYAKRLFHSLEKKYPVTFISYFESGNYSLLKKFFGYEIVEGNANLLRMGLFRFAGFLMRNQFDIIHIVTFSRFAVLAYLFHIGKKRVYTAHGIIKKEDSAKTHLPYFYKLKNLLTEKKFFNDSDIVITLSPFLRNDIHEYYPKFVKLHKQIYPGVDENFINTKLEMHNPPPLRISFLGGFLEREKAAYSLIKEIHSTLPQIKITCAAFLNINPDFPKIDYEDKSDANAWAKLLSSCDVFISPYSGETFSIATLEAMALGKIVIVSIHAGIAELIENNVNGFVVNTEIPAQTIDVLQSIGNNPGIVESISKKAILSVHTLSWDNTANRHYAAYQEIFHNRELDTV